MPCAGHCRGHITTWSVYYLNSDFSSSDLDGVKRLFVTATMLAIFLKMPLERGGACWPADAVSFAPVNQTHWSLPDD